MRFGSLFAGIGGIDLGLERAGMECVWQVEIDDYCQRVLEKHWPDVERFRDVREVGKHNLKPVDLIAGGFPCQPVSFAGKRKGQNDEQWLWDEFFRIICLLRPRYVFVENVPGLFSLGFGQVLGNLASIGYDAEWQSIPAKAFGFHHIRRRIFILAYAISRSRDKIKNKTIFGPWLSRTSSNGSSKKGWITRKPCSLPEPGLERLVNGIPSRMDKNRIKALGNAVVPQVAEWIGKRIIEFETHQERHRMGECRKG